MSDLPAHALAPLMQRQREPKTQRGRGVRANRSVARAPLQARRPSAADRISRNSTKKCAAGGIQEGLRTPLVSFMVLQFGSKADGQSYWHAAARDAPRASTIRVNHQDSETRRACVDLLIASCPPSFRKRCQKGFRAPYGTLPHGGAIVCAEDH